MSPTDAATETVLRRKSTALAAILGLSLLFGITYAMSLLSNSPGLAGLALVFQIGPLFAGFVWLHNDSIQHGYSRSMALNAGIVLLALVYVPVYFFRSRPPGTRAPAITGFFSLVLACMGLSLMGAYAVLALNPGATLPVTGS
ncbi:MAG: hypothetical protein ABI411_14615 [Tahibacter sp.]